jgi:hypothetical protein
LRNVLATKKPDLEQVGRQRGLSVCLVYPISEFH